MRICKSKADLKKNTRVEATSRNAHVINFTILDRCALLWCVAWPTSSPTSQALVRDYVESFKKCLQLHLSQGDVYLEFDRYIEFCTKCLARKVRGPGCCRIYKSYANSPLPPQKQMLTVAENKNNYDRSTLLFTVCITHTTNRTANKLHCVVRKHYEEIMLRI